MPEKQAIAVQVAEAVKARIIAGADKLTQTNYTVRRSYLEWDLDLKGMESSELSDTEMLLIDVVAHSTQQETELSARGKNRFTVPIDIAVRRKFGDNEKDKATGRIKIEEIDRYVLLIEELHLMFTAQSLANDFPYSVWDNDKGGTRILANPDRDHLREMKQFTGIVRVFLRADVNLNG